MRIFAQEVVWNRDMINLPNPCGAQEPAVVPQKPPHAARVGRIPFIKEELRSGVPSPFRDWVVDVEEQVVLVVV